MLHENSVAAQNLYDLVRSRYVKCLHRDSNRYTIYRIDRDTRCASLVGSYVLDTACLKIMTDIVAKDEDVSDAYAAFISHSGKFAARKFIAHVIRDIRAEASISPIAHLFSDCWYGLESLDRDAFMRGFNATAQELKNNSLFEALGANLSFCKFFGKLIRRLAGYTSNESHNEICFIAGSASDVFARGLLRRFPKIAVQIDAALESKRKASDFAGKFIGIATKSFDGNIFKCSFIRQVAIKRAHTRFADFRKLPVELSLLFCVEKLPIFDKTKIDAAMNIIVAETNSLLTDADFDRDIDEFSGYCYAIYTRCR